MEPLAYKGDIESSGCNAIHPSEESYLFIYENIQVYKAVLNNLT